MASGSSLKVLDLVFVVDCTGSMASYIQQAQENIRKIADEIVRQEKADLQLALIEYRDHPPQETTFVTRILDLTPSLREMKAKLDGCSAAGGGDTPEAVADALHALLKLSWRENSTKICIFIADAPPHGLSCSGDGFPEGCPCGIDPMVTGRQIAEKGIVVYMVGCEPAINRYREWFTAVAHLTGGQYIPLSSATVLPQVIISGTQEELSLKALMGEATAVVSKLSLAADGSVDQAQLERELYEKLKAKGVKTKHIQTTSGTAVPEASDYAMRLSERATLADVRKDYHPLDFKPPGAHPGFGERSGGVRAATAPGDHYATVEYDVSETQVRRMVQQSLMTSKLKAKCTSMSRTSNFDDD